MHASGARKFCSLAMCVPVCVCTRVQCMYLHPYYWLICSYMHAFRHKNNSNKKTCLLTYSGPSRHAMRCMLTCKKNLYPFTQTHGLRMMMDSSASMYNLSYMLQLFLNAHAAPCTFSMGNVHSPASFMPAPRTPEKYSDEARATSAFTPNFSPDRETRKIS